MHVRGCDCAECCPGTPAEATRVYRSRERWLVLPVTERQRRSGRIAGRLRALREANRGAGP